ncbi:hypothetical protein ACWGII_36585 [Streptomyces sp. NPDC054855]
MPRSAVVLSVRVEAAAERPTEPAPGAEAPEGAVGVVAAARTGPAEGEAVVGTSPARSG